MKTKPLVLESLEPRREVCPWGMSICTWMMERQTPYLSVATGVHTPSTLNISSVASLSSACSSWKRRIRRARWITATNTPLGSEICKQSLDQLGAELLSVFNLDMTLDKATATTWAQLKVPHAGDPRAEMKWVAPASGSSTIPTAWSVSSKAREDQTILQIGTANGFKKRCCFSCREGSQFVGHFLMENMESRSVHGKKAICPVLTILNRWHRASVSIRVGEERCKEGAHGVARNLVFLDVLIADVRRF